MTQEQIQHQIEVIKRAGAKARRTPETARRFLIEAGIIESDSKQIKPTKKKRKK